MNITKPPVNGGRGRRKLVHLLSLAALVASSLLLAPPASAAYLTFGPVDNTVTTVPTATVYKRLFTDLESSTDACAYVGSTAQYSYKFNGETGSTTQNGVTLAMTGTKETGYTMTITGGTVTDVILKSSVQNNNWYHFDPAVSSATPLQAPAGAGLSHTTYCYDPGYPSTDLDGTGAVTQHANDTATLTWTETNDGTVPLTTPTVTANNGCSPVYDSGDVNGNAVLDVGESWVFKCDVTPTATTTYTAIGSGYYNGKEVTYCASPDSTKYCDAEEIAMLTVTVINPSTALSGSGAVTQHANEQATLTWVESNDGDTPLSNVGVSANNGCSPSYVSGDTDTDDLLDVGEEWTYTCTVTPTQTTTYTAIATGQDATGDAVTWCSDPSTPPANTVCDQDERAQVTVTVINPSTDLSGSGAITQHANESATLTWSETNDGDSDLTSPTVTANNGCTTAYDSGDTDTDGVLDVGETWVFTCTVTPTQTTTYTAIGSGIDDTGDAVTWCSDPTTPPADTVCDQDERAQVDVTVINPSTSLTAGAPSADNVASGTPVTLTWSETNDGDSDLTNPAVSADNGCSPAYVSGDTADAGVLNVGETWVFQCTVTPTQTTTYTAVGTGIDAAGDAVTWCSDPTTPPADTVCDQDERAQVTVTVFALEGCTPGYWKNHPSAWNSTPHRPSHLLKSKFTSTDGTGLGEKTMMQALSFDGGTNLAGARRILLRAATASLLNASHPDVDFPKTPAEVKSIVNSVFSTNRSTILAAATNLDNMNNLGCPLN